MIFQSKFKRILVFAYGILCLCIAILLFFLYENNFSRHRQLLQSHLKEEVQSFNAILRVRYNAVSASRIQMEEFLKRNPFYFNHSREFDFETVSRGLRKWYYLKVPIEKRHLWGKITGTGDIKDISFEKWEEIYASFALNPLFVVLKKNIPSFVSASYTSLQGFQNFFPWHSFEQFHFHPSFLKRDFFTLGTPDKNPKREIYWTDSYKGFGGQAVYQTCAAPVYFNNQFKGVIAVDFHLKAIDQFMDNLYVHQGELVILNEKGMVLCDSTKRPLKPTSQWNAWEVLPKGISLGDIKKLDKGRLHRVGSHWVFSYPVNYTHWTFIYFIDHWKFLYFSMRDVGAGILWVLGFIFIFLVFSQRLVIKEFIIPSQRLIKHLAAKGQSQEGFQDIPDPWYSWFEAITLVFKENKELVKKLEGHIQELDKKVYERTQALTHKNKDLESALGHLHQAKNQIVHQEKMAGLGVITAGVAHEIKNPLNFILNFASLSLELIEDLKEALKENDTSEDARSLIESIEGNLKKVESHGQKVDKIIRSMLLHARGGHDLPEKTNINELLEENVALAHSIAKQKGVLVTITKDFDPDLPEIFVYRQDLGRVFLNLLTNSCDALKLRGEKEDKTFVPKICLTTKVKNDFVHIILWDNGVGVSGSNIKKIFEPFFTTKPAGKGTGLGLSLSYDCITIQHGGKLEIHSKENVYTQFHITLPMKSTHEHKETIDPTHPAKS